MNEEMPGPGGYQVHTQLLWMLTRMKISDVLPCLDSPSMRKIDECPGNFALFIDVVAVTAHQIFVLIFKIGASDIRHQVSG